MDALDKSREIVAEGSFYQSLPHGSRAVNTKHAARCRVDHHDPTARIDQDKAIIRMIQHGLHLGASLVQLIDIRLQLLCHCVESRCQCAEFAGGLWPGNDTGR